MHEASLARRLVEIVDDVAGGRPGRIETLHVRVGAFQSVVPDALRFAFEALRTGTRADGAELALTIEPLTVRCEACGIQPVAPDVFVPFCPRCGAVADPATGTDIVLEAIDFAADPIACEPGSAEGSAEARAPSDA